jgi:ABC-type amino acid transport system permease subunit
MDWLDNLRRSFLDWNAMLEALPTMIIVGLKNTLILAAASTVLGVVISMILVVDVRKSHTSFGDPIPDKMKRSGLMHWFESYQDHGCSQR